MSFENLPPNFDISQDETHAVFSLPIVKSSKDDRSYKLIRLPNQLEALLIHDPETDKAGASLDVAIGSFADPVFVNY
jgi:insulysin